MKINRPILTFALASLIISLGIGCKPPHDPNAEARVRTINLLRYVALMTQLATSESGKQPPREVAQLIDFLDEIDPGTVEFLAERMDIDPNTRCLYDRWRNPVRLVAKSADHYVLISPGPNGNDEDGEGDDVVQCFNPWADDLPPWKPISQRK